MSSDDQQYPYGQQYGYGYGDGDARPPQPPAPAGEQQPGQPGQQGHPGQQQPYGNGGYGDHRPQGGHAPQSYGGDHAPYDPYAGTYAPDPAAGAGPGSGSAPGAGWPSRQPQQPRPVAPAPEHGHADGHGHADQGATQTWQGQTWDTQYQPTIQPAQSQRPPGAHPLPPEVPAAYAATPAPAPAPAVAPDAAGYSSPTTVGSARMTDAQRARAEGRSPVIAPGMQPAAITAGLGLLLALGAAIGSYALFVPLVLLQAVTAAGWFRLNGMWPARQGIVLAFAGGLVADVVLLAAGRDHAPAAILGTLGVWVLLTLVLQLRSHAAADERMQGLMATVASASLAVLAAGHLAAVPDAVTVGGVAVAAAVLVRALPLPGVVSVVVALLAATGAGLVMGGFTDFGAQSALLGFAAGVCALIGLRVASYDYPSRFVHMTAGVALPLTAAAPAVYLIGRAIS